MEISDRQTYDVIVVGARCAGAATALLLARAGHRVLVLDRTRLPADTVSTHALLLGGVVQLSRWGLLEAAAATGAPPVDGVEIRAGNVSFLAAVKPAAGVDRLYALRRYLLDALLLDAAAAAGADVRTGTLVTDLLRDSAGQVVGVQGPGFAARARVVVGADGVRSRIADLVGAATLRYDAPASSCHYAYYADLPATRYEFCFAPGTAAGAIPTNDGRTCVYAMCPVQDVPALRRDLERNFAALVHRAAPGLAARLSGARRVSSFRGTRGLPSYLRQAAGPGWVLVGDAGWHRDPISAHGMTDAFRDAELAARAISASLLRGPGALAEYQPLRDRFAVPIYEATRELASYRWTTEEALAILSRFGEAAETEIAYLCSLDPALAAA